jgi:hypothetical protein
MRKGWPLLELLEDEQGFIPQNMPEKIQYFVERLFGRHMAIAHALLRNISILAQIEETTIP